MLPTKLASTQAAATIQSTTIWVGDTIDAGAGNDTITFESGNGSSINAGDGADRISLNGGYFYVVTLKGGKGNDTTYGSGNKTLHQYANGDGYDVIYNWSANDTLSLSSDLFYSRSTVGNDVVIGLGNGAVTLKGAKGKTVNLKGGLGEVVPSRLATISTGNYGKNISNSKARAIITGTSYDDTVKNSGTSARISVGAGADSVYNTGAGTSIDSGAGNDTIQNLANTVTLSGGDGNDSISNKAHQAIINGGAGADNINVNGQSNTINGGKGNDRITVTGNSNNVHGGDDNDTINVSATSVAVTITGGKGNDLINSNNGIGRTFLYASGDGNDTIQNYKSGDISITGGSYTRSTVGNDVVLTVGGGKITVKNGKGKTVNVIGTRGGNSTTSGGNSKFFTLTEGKDTYSNTISGATIQAKGGDDSIKSFYYANVSISGGAGHDYIETRKGSNRSVLLGGDGNDTIFNDDPGSISAGSYVTISGGAGNDSISNDGANSKVAGGDGNDNIRNYGSNSSIAGGAGNDSIYNVVYYSGEGNKVTINGGAGNDKIWLDNAGKQNVIQYASGDGNDIIYNFGATDTLSITSGTYTRSTVGNDILVKVGNGTITLSGANGKTVNIAGTLYTPTVQPVTQPSGKDYVVTTSGALWGLGTVITVNVRNSSNNTVSGTNGNDNFGNMSANKIIYGYSGNDTIWNLGGNSVTIDAGAGSDRIYNFTQNKCSINGGNGNDTIYSEGGLQGTIDGGTDNDFIKVNTSFATINGGTGKDTITVNGSLNKINGGDGNDNIIASTMGLTYSTINGGKGDDTINGTNASTITYVYENGGGNDVIYGFTSADTLRLPDGYSSRSTVGNDVVVKVGYGSITLKNAKGTSINISGLASSYDLASSADLIDDWIIADDKNFLNDDTNLSAIIDGSTANYSTGKVTSTYNLTSLTQKDFVTFGKK